MNDKFDIIIEGPINASNFGNLLEELNFCYRELATPEDAETMDGLLIDKISMNSPLCATIRAENTDMFVRRLNSVFSSEGDIIGRLSDTAIHHLRALVKSVNRFTSATILSPNYRISLLDDNNVMGEYDKEVYREYTTVTGMLECIDIRHKRKITVTDLLGKSYECRCRVEDIDLTKYGVLFGKRVAVKGWAIYNNLHRVIYINVVSIKGFGSMEESRLKFAHHIPYEILKQRLNDIRYGDDQ